MLRAVILDVGGTLWPDRLTGGSADEHHLPQLAALLPELDAAQCLLALRQALRADDQSLAQNTHGVLDGALQAGRRALGTQAAGRNSPRHLQARGARHRPVSWRAGAAGKFRELGMGCVVLSNVQVRGADEYWRDFADLRVAQLTKRWSPRTTSVSASHTRACFRPARRRQAARRPNE